MKWKTCSTRTSLGVFLGGRIGCDAGEHSLPVFLADPLYLFRVGRQTCRSTAALIGVILVDDYLRQTHRHLLGSPILSRR
ncbi:hypothetical protein MJ561_23785 [Klebsiella pneumoniae]|nr:hypothetical protein MJ561_23785 [Klebsiella pneumoniae]